MGQGLGNPILKKKIISSGQMIEIIKFPLLTEYPKKLRILITNHRIKNSIFTP